MATDRIPLEVVTRFQPSLVQEYLAARGWSRHATKRNLAVVYRHGGPPAYEAVVPIERELADYAERLRDVAVVISEAERRPIWQVASDLLHPRSDMVRFAIRGPSTTEGAVPVDFASEFVAAGRKALAAAACSAVEARNFHPRLSRSEADKFIGACRVSIEHGSFVAAVRCPMNAVPEDELLLLRDLMPGGGFTRKVTRYVLDTAQAILNPDANPALTLNANLLEALAAMQPLDESGTLNISATWAASTPEAATSPTNVSLEPAHLEKAASMARQLRPSNDQPQARVWIGHVRELRGAPNSDGHTAGEVVLSLFGGDEDEVLRAKLSLGAQEYAKACDVHRDGKLIAVKGELLRGVKVHRLQNASDFKEFVS